MDLCSLTVSYHNVAAKTGDGLQEGMDWILQRVKNKGENRHAR